MYTEPLIIENKMLTNQTELVETDIIYKMEDNISSVPFSINTNVLDFILTNNKKYKFYTDPAYKHPLVRRLRTKEN